jgi:hypothetical protein
VCVEREPSEFGISQIVFQSVEIGAFWQPDPAWLSVERFFDIHRKQSESGPVPLLDVASSAEESRVSLHWLMLSRNPVS